jgi:SET domain-containing protein
MLHLTKPASVDLSELGTVSVADAVSVPRKAARRKKARPPIALEVRESAVHGRGVYVTGPIRKGARIIEYKGTRVPWNEASPQADGPHTFLFGLTNGRDVIDPEIGGNEARWINHSCEPNCEAIEEGNRVFIYALRALAPGEELFYDYGLEVDEPRTRKLEREYECRCGSPGCRGTLLAAVPGRNASAE